VPPAAGVPVRRPGVGGWLRHNMVAVLATVVDYTGMITCVELVGLGPVAATVVGALGGAVTSFTLGRWFTYRALGVTVGAQAWRYALVSAASLAWNAGGEYLFATVLGLQYVVARVITSVVVSNGWNYPLQKHFVFAIKTPPAGSSSHA
jgi:putative flippase GtrA